MPLTTNVQNVGLKEIIELYYNDKGTIRNLEELWYNDGSGVKCVFRRVPPLTWSVPSNSWSGQINSVDNNGYSINFKDMYHYNRDFADSGIRSNLVTIEKGKVITVDFVANSISSSRCFSVCILLFDASGNIVQQGAEVLASIGVVTNKTTLTVNSKGNYVIGLYAVARDMDGAYSAITTNAKITIK